MGEALARSGQSSTMDILAQLEIRRAAATQTIQAIGEPNTTMRCEAIRTYFDDLYKSVRRSIPDLEQEKGMAKGLETAAVILATHAEIWKSELAETEQAEKLEHALRVVARGVKSITEAAHKQRKDVERKAGTFDGACNSAMSALQKIDGWAESVKRAREKQAEIEGATKATDEVDQALEAQAEKRRAKLLQSDNGNGAKATAITMAPRSAPIRRKPPKRKRAAAKKPENKQPN